MQWKVKSDKEVITIDSKALLDILLDKSMSTENIAFETLSQELCNVLEWKNVMKDTTPSQLSLMNFYLGYYYGVFLKKNEVEIITNDDTNTTNSNKNNSSVI